MVSDPWTEFSYIFLYILLIKYRFNIDNDDHSDVVPVDLLYNLGMR